MNSPEVPAAVQSGGPEVPAAVSIGGRGPEVPAASPAGPRSTFGRAVTYAQKYLRRRENARRLEFTLPQKYLLAEWARSWEAGGALLRCPERKLPSPAGAFAFIPSGRRVRVSAVVGAGGAADRVGLRASSATRARGRPRYQAAGRAV